MIAEKEIVLTFLLQLLSTGGILDRLAFKGGTCLRKMFVGSKGRFSTDLDFTAIEEQDHEDIILSMMETFEKEFHGIRFRIPDHSYYETVDGLSWGVNPVYSHEWNASGNSEIRRATPTIWACLSQDRSIRRSSAGLLYSRSGRLGTASIRRC